MIRVVIQRQYQLYMYMRDGYHLVQALHRTVRVVEVLTSLPTQYNSTTNIARPGSGSTDLHMDRSLIYMTNFTDGAVERELHLVLDRHLSFC